jgi:hypothetical protein
MGNSSNKTKASKGGGAGAEDCSEVQQISYYARENPLLLIAYHHCKVYDGLSEFLVETKRIDPESGVSIVPDLTRAIVDEKKALGRVRDVEFLEQYGEIPEGLQHLIMISENNIELVLGPLIGVNPLEIIVDEQLALLQKYNLRALFTNVVPNEYALIDVENSFNLIEATRRKALDRGNIRLSDTWIVAFLVWEHYRDVAELQSADALRAKYIPTNDRTHYAENEPWVDQRLAFYNNGIGVKDTSGLALGLGYLHFDLYTLETAQQKLRLLVDEQDRRRAQLKKGEKTFAFHNYTGRKIELYNASRLMRLCFDAPGHIQILTCNDATKKTVPTGVLVENYYIVDNSDETRAELGQWLSGDEMYTRQVFVRDPAILRHPQPCVYYLERSSPASELATFGFFLGHSSSSMSTTTTTDYRPVTLDATSSAAYRCHACGTVAGCEEEATGKPFCHVFCQYVAAYGLGAITNDDECRW